MSDTPGWLAAATVVNGGLGVMVAFIAARNGLRATAYQASQADISKRKLNLDLYDRRYELWQRVTKEVDELLDWSESDNRYRDTIADIILHVDEVNRRLLVDLTVARFLFEQPVRSSMVALLVETRKLAEERSLTGLHSRDLAQRTRSRESVTESYARIANLLGDFTNAVTLYLDFANIGLKSSSEPITAAKVVNAFKAVRENWRYLANDRNWS